PGGNDRRAAPGADDFQYGPNPPRAGDWRARVGPAIPALDAQSRSVARRLARRRWLLAAIRKPIRHARGKDVLHTRRMGTFRSRTHRSSDALRGSGACQYPLDDQPDASDRLVGPVLPRQPDGAAHAYPALSVTWEGGSVAVHAELGPADPPPAYHRRPATDSA